METIIKEHALKFRSKKELYNILLAGCDAYLPLIQFENSLYIKGVVREAKLGWIALIYFTSACRVQLAKNHPSSLACTLNNSKDNGVWNEQIRSENLPKYKKFRLPSRPDYIIWINSSISIRLVYTVNRQGVQGMKRLYDERQIIEIYSYS